MAYKVTKRGDGVEPRMNRLGEHAEAAACQADDQLDKGQTDGRCKRQQSRPPGS